MLTDIQKLMLHGKVCPYCKGKSEYVSSEVVYGIDYGMLYLCRKCDAYVGVHSGTNRAKGRLANKELRALKIDAHKYFDKIWRDKHMSRNEAYLWLSKQLKIPHEYTHIGMFNPNTCLVVISVCKKYLVGSK